MQIELKSPHAKQPSEFERCMGHMSDAKAPDILAIQRNYYTVAALH
jgi:hypothetical protein